MSPILGQVLFFLLVLLVLSFISAILISKFIPREVRVAHRMLMQPALTVAGMMFSVLLGFFIAQGLRDNQIANQNITNEANAVGEVFRDARGLPEADRKRIRNLCRKYVETVINDEWPLLDEGSSSPEAQAIMNELWHASLSVEPRDDREVVIYDNLFRAMNELGGHRRIRTAVAGYGLAPHLWAIIATGAAAIVSLTFMFAPDSKAFHAGLLSCLLIPLTLNIFLLAEFSYPFSGLVAVVRPVMFERLQKTILVVDDNPPKFLPKSTSQGATP